MADAGSVIRVKLDLRCAIPHRDAHNLVWIVVDRAETATIKQLSKLIRTKYGVSKKSELYLDDAWLPPDETLQILRDKDTVRVVTPAQQPSNSDSPPDEDPDPTTATDKPAEEKKKKKRKREPSESTDAPVVEAAHVSSAAGRNPSTSSASTPKQGATPCFPAAQLQSTPSFQYEPICSTPQDLSVGSTPGWPVPTPDPSLAGSVSPAKKKRRPRRKKKKPDEVGAQDAASPSLPPPAPVCVPLKPAHPDLSSGKHLRFDGDTSDGEEEEVAPQQNALCMVVEEQQPCAVNAAAPTKGAEQESQPPLTNGQTSWVPLEATGYSPPPAEVSTPKAKIQKLVEDHKAPSSADCTDGSSRQVKDYSNYPPLKVPPKVGDVIAFKILELDANYCPNVSDYKEGKVLQHNPVSDFVRIELRQAEAKKTYGGKFELEVPEEGMPPMEKVVSLLWTELLEPVVLPS
ncbi:coilin [Dermacentor silvarum]|uniref:coilin n=1 Tax=Dermacentor silvarum TaxID=543639 RepID=UPI001897CB63|nr:coilin [Dermacentor silvarum]